MPLLKFQSADRMFMFIRSISALAMASAACTFLPLSHAQVSAGDTSADAKQTRVWLTRIHEAARKHNFQGTFIVSAGGVMSSARIAHFCEGGNQFERIESLDGQARHVFRHNELVHTVWPQSRVALVEQRDALTSFPALLQNGDDRIVDFYDVRAQGAERVAGHEADVLWLRPRDSYRYGYRLWAEKNSGLLLRADVLGERSEVLESSAFSDVTIGVKPHPETVLQPMKKLEGYRVMRPVMTPTRLEVEGWSLRRPVPGFQQVSCVKRPLDSAAPEASQHSLDSQAIQTIFSDGLTYVSVFIEPYKSERHARAMHAAMGATQTLMRRQGDWWITVVGDVPAATLRAFATGLERQR
jgi:sigma-E factor negative regulatory protein RseB